MTPRISSKKLDSLIRRNYSSLNIKTSKNGKYAVVSDVSYVQIFSKRQEEWVLDIVYTYDRCPDSISSPVSIDIDIEGTTVVVGVPGGKHASGKVYVYKKDKKWTLVQKLTSLYSKDTPEDLGLITDTWFGLTVALTSDADNVIVESSYNNSTAMNPLSNKHIFKLQGGEYIKAMPCL